MHPPCIGMWPERSFAATRLVCAMALIAAASIDIDFSLFLAFLTLFIFLAALAYLCRLARGAVRRVCMNDDIQQIEHRKRRGYHGAFNRRHA